MMVENMSILSVFMNLNLFLRSVRMLEIVFVTLHSLVFTDHAVTKKNKERGFSCYISLCLLTNSQFPYSPLQDMN
jgi:hypothetical protein